MAHSTVSLTPTSLQAPERIAAIRRRSGKSRSEISSHAQTDLVNNRYRILGHLGTGGMSVVYRAYDTKLNRPCALKVLVNPQAAEPTPTCVHRFFREAEALIVLNHPNTVRVIDRGTDPGGVYYIAMELLEGQPLSDVLKDRGALSEAQMINIAKQVCGSLAEAHDFGFVHRDLKTSNVFVMSSCSGADVIKVIDFGLAKRIDVDDELSLREGEVVGTPRYMAPEQVMGGEIDGRTDVYALGVMMFEMMTGYVPFLHADHANTMLAHIEEDVPSLESVKPDVVVSPDTRAVILRCLEKLPARRFQSVRLLHQALESSERNLCINNGAEVDQPWDDTIVGLEPEMVDIEEIEPDAVEAPDPVDTFRPMEIRVAGASLPEAYAECHPPQQLRGNTSEQSSAFPLPRKPMLLGFMYAACLAAIAGVTLHQASDHASVLMDMTPIVRAAAASVMPMHGMQVVEQRKAKVDRTPDPISVDALQAEHSTASKAPVAASLRYAEPKSSLRLLKVVSEPAGATADLVGLSAACSPTPCSIYYELPPGPPRQYIKLVVSMRGYSAQRLLPVSSAKTVRLALDPEKSL